MSEQNTPTRADVIAMRREAVAAMRARGLSLREIRESLANLDEPIIVSHGTVVRLTWQWQSSAGWMLPAESQR